MIRPTGISLDINTAGHRKVKIDCPSCGKKKCYSRYIDWGTMSYLPVRFGRCDRENSCGYHEKPDLASTKEDYTPRRIKPCIAHKTQKNFEQNPFVKWLLSLFDEGEVMERVATYDIGTAKMYEGSCVFWQRDIKGEYRSGKIMGYDAQTGRRQKEQTNWVHRTLFGDKFHLEQCLFGEYLVMLKDLPIALFESEKTALIFDLMHPDEYICMATGAKDGIGGKSLNREKVKFMRGRQVVLYPDASPHGTTYDQWYSLSRQMQEYDIDATIVNLDKELVQEQRQKGLDIADILLMEHAGIYTDFQTEDIEKMGYIPF